MNSLFALVAFNNERWQAAVEKLLTSFGFTTVCCRSGASANKIVQNRKFNLLAVDWNLHGIEDLLSLKLTNSQGYRTTVVAVADDRDAVNGICAKRVDFAVPRSCVAEQLADTLESAHRLILTEKRRALRRAVSIRAFVANRMDSGNDLPIEEATLLDISRTGLSLKSKNRVEEGAKIFVYLQLPKGHGEVHIVGDAIWSDVHNRLGMKFTNIPPFEFKRLLNWLEDRSSAPRTGEAAPTAPKPEPLQSAL